MCLNDLFLSKKLFDLIGLSKLVDNFNGQIIGDK